MNLLLLAACTARLRRVRLHCPTRAMRHLLPMGTHLRRSARRAQCPTSRRACRSTRSPSNRSRPGATQRWPHCLYSCPPRTPSPMSARIVCATLCVSARRSLQRMYSETRNGTTTNSARSHLCPPPRLLDALPFAFQHSAFHTILPSGSRHSTLATLHTSPNNQLTTLIMF